MHSRVLIDNDVLAKVAAWGLDEALLQAMGSTAGVPGMLSAARFVVRKLLVRRGLADPDAAAAAFERLCAAMVLLEPEPGELVVAAALEEAALRAGVELDAGESQLTAMLIARNARLLLTGDKRAMTALATLKPEESVVGLRRSNSSFVFLPNVSVAMSFALPSAVSAKRTGR